MIFRHEKASTGHFTCAVQHAGKWFHLNDETVLSLDSFFLDSPLASLPSLVATTQKWQPAQLPQVTYSVYPRSFHNQSAALDDFRGTEPLLSEPAIFSFINFFTVSEKIFFSSASSITEKSGEIPSLSK